MIRVKNKKAITNLSTKSIQANKVRNMIAVVAIALTALMFTTLFTVGGGMIKTFELTTSRQVGTISHAGYKEMTQEDYDTVKIHPLIKQISYNIFIGMATNPELSKEQVEVRYSEDQSAMWGFNYPTTGRMPKEKMDLATTTTVLDALGVKHKIGEPVTLSVNVDGQEYTEEFTLCGFWESDSIAPAQEVWLSREYVDEVAPMPTKPIDYTQDTPKMAGYISSDIMFANSWNIEKKLDQVTKDSGINEENVNSGVNWAYGTSTIDSDMVMIILIILVLIVISGYLIIYNVFYISVARDIRYYGLLKTIGTTGKQLKKMVRRQATLLALPGIVIGLIAGWGVGSVILPSIMKNFNFAGSVQHSASPLIFVCAALFSLTTVYISCNKPARLASKVSPMEALHSQEVSVSKKLKKAHKVSEWNMALQNVFRNKKKVVIVVLSLSLSLIILNATYGAIKSFSLDKYLENEIASDFTVSNTTLQNRYELTYVDPNIVDEVQKLDGIEQSGCVYMEENYHQLSDTAWKRMIGFVDEYKKEDSMIASYEDIIKEDPNIPAHVYGLDPMIFDKLELKESDLDWKKFNTGDYVIVSPFGMTEQGLTDACYHVGDKVHLSYDSGDEKEYTVLAIASLKYPLTCLHGHGLDESFYLPTSEYKEHATFQDPIHVCLDVEHDKENEIEQKIATLSEASQIDYTSKAQAIADFEDNLKMYRMVGTMLFIIMGLIGIINFFNSIVTSIYTRKQELAMLQSVGMTGKQMKKMLVLEGICYAVFTLAFVLTFGIAISYGLIQAIAGMTWFFEYYFSVLPVLCCAPFILAIVIIVPYACYHSVEKQSIVERLREAE